MSNEHVNEAFRQVLESFSKPVASAMYADRQMQEAQNKRIRELEHDNAELQRQLQDSTARLANARRAITALSQDIDEMCNPGYDLQLPGQVEWTPIPQHVVIAGVKQLVIEKADALEAIVEQKYMDWLAHVEREAQIAKREG